MSHSGTHEYELACECDRNGREAEAIGHYRAALDAGLGGNDRRGALLGLGSSLSNVEQFDESVATLEDAVAEFPDYPPLAAFLALSLHSAGRTAEATATALRIATGTNLLDGYERVLNEYCDDLVTTAVVRVARNS